MMECVQYSDMKQQMCLEEQQQHCHLLQHAPAVRRNCLLVVETWERINQLFGHSKQHTHNAAK